MRANGQNKESEKKYLFDRCVSSVLQKGSLAFNVSLARRLERTSETQTVVRINKSLLPQHCDLKIIEAALACLEKHPQDTQLLKILGEYTKNNLSERIGYWSMGGGTTLGSSFFPLAPILFVVRLSVLAGLLAAVIMAPIIIDPLIGAGVALVVYAAVVFAIWNQYRNGSIGMKIGRWIGNLLKGTSQKSANLRECEDNLKACINKYKTAGEQGITSMLGHQVSHVYPSLEGAVAEKILSPQVSKGVDGDPSYSGLFQSADKAEDSASNTLDSLLESTTEDTRTLGR